MCGCTHAQAGAYPIQRHRGFPPQPRRNPDFLRIAFASPLQVLSAPTQRAELLLNNSLGLCQSRLPNFLAGVLRAGQLADLRQQLLPKVFAARAPTPI